MYNEDLAYMETPISDLLKLNTESLTIIKAEYERLMERDEYIIISAKAKLQRTEPLSEEFEEVVKILEDAEADLDRRMKDHMLFDLELRKREYGNY